MTPAPQRRRIGRPRIAGDVEPRRTYGQQLRSRGLIVSFRIGNDLYDAMCDKADNRHISLAEAIRQACLRWTIQSAGIHKLDT